MGTLMLWEKSSQNILMELQKSPLSELLTEKVNAPQRITTSRKLSFPLFLKRLQDHHYKSCYDFIAEVEAFFDVMSTSEDYNYYEQQIALFMKQKFQKKIPFIFSCYSIKYWIQSIIKLKTQMNTLFHQIPKNYDPLFPYIQFPNVEKSFELNSKQIEYLQTRLPQEKDPVHLYYITRILEEQTEFVDTCHNSIQLDFKTIPPLALNTIYHYMRQIDGLPIDIPCSENDADDNVNSNTI